MCGPTSAASSKPRRSSRRRKQVPKLTPPPLQAQTKLTAETRRAPLPAHARGGAAAGDRTHRHRHREAATRSLTKIPVSSPQLAKHALEAHVTRVLLVGFEHESFYLDGSLSSLLDPAAFRRERYTQFRDMRGMEPAELLGLLPTCPFGRYAASKFAALLPPRVEQAILGDGEHRRAVEGGAHPRTPFYGEFLRAAKAVWMLHLLAFALETPPSHFEAGRGAEFHPDYMESVAGGRGGGAAGMVVGFAVAPGFRLGNGAVVRARVYLVPRGGRP
uniref:GIL1/IRKI C-terminal domain-containing protein n=1 Tax=Oryza barthii TaxID=65489 RepID=A0A0D3H129_9ORYZ